ncbi:hypothetical protein QYM36_019463 [Artemia franciscana]|uniref:Uncharacterized protein n=1 Tax=Artemia franciscana TaxID=6661 RepID=A0AA88KZB1_ARTSF|nr:hypothetical protein QYM36_019463 [Artemia franciscana]
MRQRLSTHGNCSMKEYWMQQIIYPPPPLLKLSLIVCYVLTNYADHTLKDEFYDNPHSAMESILLHDVTCITGDLKAKVGQDRSYSLKVMGQHRLGIIDENGAQLFSFTKGNDLLISAVPLDIPDQLLFILHISDEKQIADELLPADKRLKNKKAPGGDRISEEMIKFSIRRALAI